MQVLFTDYHYCVTIFEIRGKPIFFNLAYYCYFHGQKLMSGAVWKEVWHFWSVKFANPFWLKNERLPHRAETGTNKSSSAALSHFLQLGFMDFNFLYHPK